MTNKICEKCSKPFPSTIKIDNKWRNLNNRLYCFECSPFGKHNTTDLNKKPMDTNGLRFCTICKKTKSFTEYFKSKSKHKKNEMSTYCKKCMSAFQVKRWIKLKLEAIKYKGGACVKCGYNKYYGALEFHHSDPLQKDYTWDKLKRRKGDIIKKELDKCILLCSNCHKEEHQTIKYKDVTI